MKNTMWMLAAMLALAPAAIAADQAEKGHEHMHHEHAAAAPAAGATTLEGNVVDMACYMSGHADTDPKHAKCAKACVVGGAPAGLVGADGTLYLLLEDHDSPKPYAAAKKLAGEKAKLAGSIVEKGGMKGLVVSGAEKTK